MHLVTEKNVITFRREIYIFFLEFVCINFIFHCLLFGRFKGCNLQFVEGYGARSAEGCKEEEGWEGK